MGLWSLEACKASWIMDERRWNLFCALFRGDTDAPTQISDQRMAFEDSAAVLNFELKLMRR